MSTKKFKNIMMIQYIHWWSLFLYYLIQFNKVNGIPASLTDTSCIKNDHRVDTLPYFDHKNGPMLCMYAGTIPVLDDNNLFYWMFKTKLDHAPLAIWMNGGPGASSQLANFLFNGPLRIVNGTNEPFEVTRVTTGTWVDIADMIYLDQPVGTGFSYGKNWRNNTHTSAKDFVQFMLGLFEKYPHLQEKRLFLTGESYSGRYLPTYAKALLDYNRDVKAVFNLEAILVGDPLVSSHAQRNSMYILPTALNTLDSSSSQLIAALQRQCDETFTAENYPKSSTVCYGLGNYVSMMTGQVQLYDNRIFSRDWAPLETPVTSYFSTVNPRFQEVVKLLHLEASTNRPIFQLENSRVNHYYTLEIMVDFSEVYEELITRKLPILVYAGEFDSKDGPVSQNLWINKLNFPGSDTFFMQPRQIYYIDGGEVGGYYRESDFFTYLTLPKAGHYAPANNFPATFAFFRDYITKSHPSLTCTVDKKQGGCSTEKMMCQIMNNCNGNGRCVPNTGGICECFQGWKGGDCSMVVHPLTGKSGNYRFDSIGPKWYTFDVLGGIYNVQIKSQLPVHVYVSKKLDVTPNNFESDMKFESIKQLTINPRDLHLGDRYSLTIFVYSAKERNEIFSNELNVEISQIRGQGYFEISL